MLRKIDKNSHYGRYANIQIADDTGTIDLIIYSSIYQTLKIDLKTGENLLISASCQVDETEKLRLTKAYKKETDVVIKISELN